MSNKRKSGRSKTAIRTVEKALKLVTVTLTVSPSKFVDVLTSNARAHRRSTQCDITADPQQAQATLSKAEKGHPPTLTLKGGGATLCFQIASKDPKVQYYPLGIAFRRRKSPVPDNDPDDLLGRKNFSFGTMHLFGRSLYITDHFKDCGPGDRYKFSVIIQRQHDGAIGIIDPPLDHEHGPK
jgi:hypothetical protein